MVDLIGRKRRKKKEEKIWIAEIKGSELIHLRCENKVNRGRRIVTGDSWSI